MFNSSVIIFFRENTVHEQIEKNIDIDIMSPRINSNKEQNIGNAIPNTIKMTTIWISLLSIRGSP